MNEKNEFKPYIPADRVMPELTVTSIVMGMLLAVIFGAANAYLGLRVGMTVSASIPAAVISMGVIRVIMKRNSILESNMVQNRFRRRVSGSRSHLYNAGSVPLGRRGTVRYAKSCRDYTDRTLWWSPWSTLHGTTS